MELRIGDYHNILHMKFDSLQELENYLQDLDRVETVPEYYWLVEAAPVVNTLIENTGWVNSTFEYLGRGNKLVKGALLAAYAVLLKEKLVPQEKIVQALMSVPNALISTPDVFATMENVETVPLQDILIAAPSDIHFRTRVYYCLVKDKQGYLYPETLQILLKDYPALNEKDQRLVLPFLLDHEKLVFSVLEGKVPAFADCIASLILTCLLYGKDLSFTVNLISKVVRENFSLIIEKLRDTGIEYNYNSEGHIIEKKFWSYIINGTECTLTGANLIHIEDLIQYLPEDIFWGIASRCNPRSKFAELLLNNRAIMEDKKLLFRLLKGYLDDYRDHLKHEEPAITITDDIISQLSIGQVIKLAGRSYKYLIKDFVRINGQSYELPTGQIPQSIKQSYELYNRKEIIPIRFAYTGQSLDLTRTRLIAANIAGQCPASLIEDFLAAHGQPEDLSESALKAGALRQESGVLIEN